jgi:hypothetical protein
LLKRENQIKGLKMEIKINLSKEPVAKIIHIYDEILGFDELLVKPEDLENKLKELENKLPPYLFSECTVSVSDVYEIDNPKFANVGLDEYAEDDEEYFNFLKGKSLYTDPEQKSEVKLHPKYDLSEMMKREIKEDFKLKDLEYMGEDVYLYNINGKWIACQGGSICEITDEELKMIKEIRIQNA